MVTPTQPIQATAIGRPGLVHVVKIAVDQHFFSSIVEQGHPREEARPLVGGGEEYRTRRIARETHRGGHDVTTLRIDLPNFGSKGRGAPTFNGHHLILWACGIAIDILIGDHHPGVGSCGKICFLFQSAVTWIGLKKLHGPELAVVQADLQGGYRRNHGNATRGHDDAILIAIVVHHGGWHDVMAGSTSGDVFPVALPLIIQDPCTASCDFEHGGVGFVDFLIFGLLVNRSPAHLQHVAIAHTACTVPNPLTLGVDRNVGFVLDVGQCCTLEEQGHIRAILPSPPIFFNGHGMASADGSNQLTGKMGRCYRSIGAQGKTGRWELKGFTRLEGQGGSDHVH